MVSLQELREAFEELDDIAQDIYYREYESPNVYLFEQKFRQVYKMGVETYHAIGIEEHPLKRVMAQMCLLWVTYRTNDDFESRRQFFAVYYRFVVFRCHKLDPTHEPCFLCEE